jgi:hypothetical protein
MVESKTQQPHTCLQWGRKTLPSGEDAMPEFPILLCKQMDHGLPGTLVTALWQVHAALPNSLLPGSFLHQDMAAWMDKCPKIAWQIPSHVIYLGIRTVTLEFSKGSMTLKSWTLPWALRGMAEGRGAVRSPACGRSLTKFIYQYPNLNDHGIRKWDFCFTCTGPKGFKRLQNPPTFCHLRLHQKDSYPGCLFLFVPSLLASQLDLWLPNLHSCPK